MPGMVPFPPTVLTQGGDTVNQATTAVYTTASFTPTPSCIQYALIAVKKQSGTTPPPTLTGNGLTWILELEGVSTTPAHTSINNLYLYKAHGALAAAGTLQISFSAGSVNSNWENCVWIVFEIGAVALVNVQAVRQDDGVTTNTSMTINLSPFADSKNGTLGCIAVMFNSNTAITPGSGFTEVAEQLSDDPTGGNDLRIQVQAKTTNDQTVDWTFVNLLNARVMGFAIELDWSPDDATHLRYFGGGNLFYINSLTVPRYSADYGATWTDASTPSGGSGSYDRCKVAVMDSAFERAWSIWTNTDSGGGIAICYSTDFGATWTVSEEISGATTFATDIACHPADTGRIAVVGAIGSNANVWVTQDRGVSWASRAGPALLNTISYQPIVSGSSAYIAWTPYGRLLISTGGRLSTADGDLYYSDDLGVGWTKATVPSPAPNRNWNVRLFRVGGFGPYFMLYGDEATGAAASALLRSDDHGVTWINVLTPNTTELFAGLEHDAVTDTLLLSTPSHVYGLSPSNSDDIGDWSDLTNNFYSVALTGQYIFQPFAYVGDPQQ